MKKSLLFGSAVLAALFLFVLGCGQSGDPTSPVTPPPAIAARSAGVTVTAGDTALKITVTGGALTQSLRIFIKDDGTAVTITKAASLTGYTEFTGDISQTGSLIMARGLTAAASGGGGGALDSDNAVTVTLAADAQSAQAASLTGLSKEQVVLPDATYTIVASVSTTSGELYFDTGAGKIQVGDGAGTTDYPIDSDIDEAIDSIVSALQVTDMVTITSGDSSAITLTAVPAGIAAFNGILQLAPAVTLDAAFTIDGGETLTIPESVNLILGSSVAITLTNDAASPARIVFAGTGAVLSAGGSGSIALSSEGGIFVDADNTDDDKIPVSSYSELTITGDDGDLNTIEYTAGTNPYITGPKSAGGSSAEISATTDCVT
jgi:hypothetical protein